MKNKGKSKEELLEELEKINQRVSEFEQCETEHVKLENLISKLCALKEQLIAPSSLKQKLKLITDCIVGIFDVDFARIWMIGEGDLCEKGCIYANVKEGPDLCPDQTCCFHLMASSGHYNSLNDDHRRIPLGWYKLGRIAFDKYHKFITNDAPHDLQIYNHEWAKNMGLVSFACFSFRSPEEKSIGFLELFSQHTFESGEEALLEDLANTISYVIMVSEKKRAIIESEAKYQTIFEDSGIAMLFVNEDMTISRVNKECEKLTGYSKAEIEGKLKWTELVANKDDLKRMKEYHHSRRSDLDSVPTTYEFKFLDKNGLIKDGIVTVSMIPGTMRSFVSLIDISERKRVEQTLQKSEKKFRNLIEQLYDGVVLFDEDVKIVEWNNAQEKITGLKKEEVLGRLMWDVAFQLVPEENKTSKLLEFIKKGMSDISTAGKILGPNMSREIKIQRPDGVSRIVEVVEFPIRTNKGFMTSSITRDVTERKRVESALFESEENFRAIAENASEGILIARGNKGIHVYANRMAAEITGYTTEELTNRTIADLAHPNELNKLMRIYNSRMAGETVSSTHETCILKKNNEPVPVEITGAKTVWGGQPADLVLIQDITKRKNAENALKRANLYNRNLIEVNLDPLVTIGLNGKITDVNNATEAVTGYSRDNLIGTDFSDYFTEPKKAMEGYELVLEQGYVQDYPLEIQDKEGHITPVLYNASVYQDESGEIIGVFAAARDITELKKAEEKIHMLANVVESSDDAIISKSLEGRITSWNKGAEEIYGFSAEEVLGKDISILAPPHLKNEIRTLIEKIKRGEHVLHYETIRVRKDNVQLNISLTLSPVFDSSGILIGISTIARDITLRKRAEKELKNSQERLKILFDYAPDSLFLLDLKGNLVDCNLAVEKSIGYGRDELVGRNLATAADILPRKQIPKLATKLAKIALGYGPIEPIELDFTRKGGKLITMEMTAYLVNIKGQRLLFAIGRDITERKQMEEQIKQSLEEKDILLREIHHRVKNNLMVISSLLNLQSRYIKDKGALEIFKESQSRARSMAIIHERLYQSTDLKRIDFGDFIKALAMELFRSYNADPGNIKLNMDLENLELDINTTVPLGLIVNELISNCLKHAFPNGEKGEINIYFHKINEEYILKVSDTGVGFPEGIDFRNTESLGLQLVTNLTAQIDGIIELERNHGTEFTIKFKEVEL